MIFHNAQFWMLSQSQRFMTYMLSRYSMTRTILYISLGLLLLLVYSRLRRWLKLLRRDFRQNKLLPSLALEDSYGLMGLTILLLSMGVSGTQHPTETTSQHGMPEWLLSKPTRISVWVSND